MGNLTTRLDAFARREVRPAFGGQAQRVDLGHADVAQLRSVVASYSGHLRHGQAMRAWDGAWQRHPWLGALFERRGWAFDERWRGPSDLGSTPSRCREEETHRHQLARHGVHHETQALECERAQERRHAFGSEHHL